MKNIVFTLLLLSSVVSAEEYICSYPNYTNGDPVILKISINGDRAKVGGKYSSNYRVLENNDIGLVLTRSFSTEGTESPKQHDIGLFALVIDKAKMKMIRGSVTYPDTENSLRTGTCSK
ncbi:hypothetical protein [Microbulbifer sp. JTAC008]|uniref:hypothetical protein n=1 Tax=unclassified Microbulbifer TaxID=2619833 RepID=UPI0040392403